MNGPTSEQAGTLRGARFAIPASSWSECYALAVDEVNQTAREILGDDDLPIPRRPNPSRVVRMFNDKGEAKAFPEHFFARPATHFEAGTKYVYIPESEPLPCQPPTVMPEYLIEQQCHRLAQHAVDLARLRSRLQSVQFSLESCSRAVALPTTTVTSVDAEMLALPAETTPTRKSSTSRTNSATSPMRATGTDTASM